MSCFATFSSQSFSSSFGVVWEISRCGASDNEIEVCCKMWQDSWPDQKANSKVLQTNVELYRGGAVFQMYASQGGRSGNILTDSKPAFASAAGRGGPDVLAAAST